MADVFRFKHFSIAQDQCAMKVGTDGILLGAWAISQSPRRIIDVGTGTGLIALMLAQRFPDASLQAIEIDAAACEQAKENFRNSPWCDRLTAVCECFLKYSTRMEFRVQYDLIVSNPPWFNESLKSGSASRDLARHTGALSSGNLIRAAARMLSADGRFCIILPHEQRSSFGKLAEDAGLFCQHCCDVLPTKTKAPKRMLMQLSHRRPDEGPQQSQFVVETEHRHVYTQEFIAMTKDFYLRF